MVRLACSWFLMLLMLLSLVGAPPLRAEEPTSIEDPVSLETALETMDALRRRQRELVRRLLASDDDRALAWGATWAPELSLTDLVPELMAVLRREAEDAESVGYYGMLAVFDALVRLEARPELDDLLPFLETRHGRGHDHEAPAVILAVRGGNPHTLLALFDVLDRRDGSWVEGWFALGNALAEKKAAGFASRLLDRIEVRLVITVRDPDDRFGGRGGSRDLGVGCGDGRLPEREGYPPIWRYDLSRHASDGRQLLAGGVVPIYIERRLARRGFGTTTRTPSGRSEQRFDWLAAMVRSERDRLPLRTRHYATVEWTDASAFLADVDAARAKVQASFAELLVALQRHDALSAGEARRAKLRVPVEVRDQRTDTSVPLPSVED